VKRGFLLGVLSLVAVFGYSGPAPASTPARASGTDQPPAKKCVTAEEARVRAAGDSGGEAPKFSAAFSKRAIVLDASLDGLDGSELPVSIEQVCDIPKARMKEARQLPGTDGVVLVLPTTGVWQDGKRVSGTAATVALDGADTASMRVRLVAQRSWHQDEDGNPVPTFRARRIRVTD
jgi:hypothetical protein